MNNVHKKIQVTSSLPLCVRFSVGAFALACSALGADPAIASDQSSRQEQRDQHRDERRDDRQSQQQRGADRHDDNHNDSRAERRDSRGEEQRRAMQERADAVRRNGRLTPDERRDLRRQINEAGQDIYATPPRH